MRKTTKSPGEKIVKDIKRATRKQYSSEEKIRIVLDGLRGEDSIAELCRREGISQGLYYKWSKDFMEAGKKRLAGDTARAANSVSLGSGQNLGVYTATVAFETDRRPSRTAALVTATLWAPRGDHLMRLRLPIRAFPMSSTQPSAREVEIGRPWRYRQP